MAKQRGVALLLREREVLLIARFVLAGLLNTAFGYACFAGLILAGMGPTAALVLATVAGIAFNFQTSRRLVFGSPGSIVRFVGVYAAMLGLNWLALRGLIGVGLPPLIAQAALVLPVAATSFLVQRALIFQPAPRRG